MNAAHAICQPDATDLFNHHYDSIFDYIKEHAPRSAEKRIRQLKHYFFWHGKGKNEDFFFKSSRESGEAIKQSPHDIKRGDYLFKALGFIDVTVRRHMGSPTKEYRFSPQSIIDKILNLSTESAFLGAESPNGIDDSARSGCGDNAKSITEQLHINKNNSYRGAKVAGIVDNTQTPEIEQPGPTGTDFLIEDNDKGKKPGIPRAEQIRRQKAERKREKAKQQAPSKTPSKTPGKQATQGPKTTVDALEWTPERYAMFRTIGLENGLRGDRNSFNGMFSKWKGYWREKGTKRTPDAWLASFGGWCKTDKNQNYVLNASELAQAANTDVALTNESPGSERAVNGNRLTRSIKSIFNSNI